MSKSGFQAVRLEKGAILPSAAVDAATGLSLEFCDVSGFGELAWAELAGTSEGEKKRIEGPLTLLDLKGRLRVAGALVLGDYVCTLSRHTLEGFELTGGRLIEAKVLFAEITFAPLIAEEITTQPRPPSSVTAAAPPLALSPPPESKIDDRWSKAIAESDRVTREAMESGEFDESDESDVRPSRGDIVQHRQFGRCVAVSVGDDHITLRKPDRRNVRLGLAVLQFRRAGGEDGKDVYEVDVRPKH